MKSATKIIIFILIFFVFLVFFIMSLPWFIFKPYTYSYTSVDIVSGSENATVYVPVLLDENGEVLKMYESLSTKGDLKTEIIITEYGKALKIRGSEGRIHVRQDHGEIEEKRFINETKISMSNFTISEDWRTSIRANDYAYMWVYSENDVSKFKLEFRRISGWVGGEGIYIGSWSTSPIRLTKGWQLINISLGEFHEDI